MAIAFVSGTATATSQNGSASSIASTAQSHTTGNLIVVGVRWLRSSSQDSNTPTDTAGNTYALISQVDRSSDRIEMWYAYNVTGNASNVVTVTFTAAATYRVIGVVEFSGVLTASDPKDQAPTGGGAAATSVSTGSFTPAESNEVSIAWSQCANIPNTWTPDTSYTSAVQDSDTICMMQYLINPATSSQTVTATTGGGQTKSILAVTFKQASGGGGVVIPVFMAQYRQRWN